VNSASDSPAEAFICEAVRTPIGRYGGALAAVRADDLAAIPIAALLKRQPALDPAAIEDVFLGCANQAGEDNRNVARMAALLAGLPVSVPGATVNRLCGSGLDAVAIAARTIRSGEAQLAIAGGVESMSRAPFVIAKADSAFSRNAEIFDTTIGWRFVNARLKERYGVDSMPETGENVAAQFNIARAQTRTASRCAVSNARRRPRRVASMRASSCRSRFRSARASRRSSWRAMSIRDRRRRSSSSPRSRPRFAATAR